MTFNKWFKAVQLPKLVRIPGCPLSSFKEKSLVVKASLINLLKSFNLTRSGIKQQWPNLRLLNRMLISPLMINSQSIFLGIALKPKVGPSKDSRFPFVSTEQLCYSICWIKIEQPDRHIESSTYVFYR